MEGRPPRSQLVRRRGRRAAAARGEEQVSLTELAVPFAKHICEHLEVEDKQGTSESSEFLEQCRAFNKNEIN